MKIAFYAPLKSPDHPVPSGDRTMGRLLMRALALGGHGVELASSLRVFLSSPDQGMLAQAQSNAEVEVERITGEWVAKGAPDLWLCYHPYYKSPDLIGPAICRRFAIPYASVESSWSQRRNQGDWAYAQEAVVDALRTGAVNISMTSRDAAGLAALGLKVARLAPFIDGAPFLSPSEPEGGHLVTAAMMRKGDKLSSYLALAKALALVSGNWRLSIAGDGPARAEVEEAFAPLGPRIRFMGELGQAELARLYASGWLYLWPGHGEAYGLAALEAQAAGLPVLSENVAGVPEVVRDGVTGVLTAPGDTRAYAAAIAGLLSGHARRDRMATAARNFALGERSLERAATALGDILDGAMR